MISSVFPVVCCDDLDEARDFYVELLDLVVEFESGWYTTMTSLAEPRIRLGFVQAGHPSLPDSLARRAAGVLISVIVADVEAVHRTALAMGAEVVWELQDEAFGQRHFMVTDPTGLVIDIITETRPSRAFLAEVARWRRANR
ncbi:MAG: VOC family protein [Actinomycetota bacterium]|nr:VOC family protein [Actinomycetota bacterium]